MTFDLPTFHTPWIEHFPLNQPAGTPGQPGARTLPFESLSTMGGFHVPGHTWQFEPTLPSELEVTSIWMSCSGFQLRFGEDSAFRMLNCGKGVWLGKAPSTVTPELFSTRDELHQDGELSWIESENQTAVLSSVKTGSIHCIALCTSETDSLDEVKHRVALSLESFEDSFERRWDETVAMRNIWTSGFPEDAPLEPPLLALEQVISLLEEKDEVLVFNPERLEQEDGASENRLPFLLEALAPTGPEVCQRVIDGLKEPSPGAWPVTTQAVARLQSIVGNRLNTTRIGQRCEVWLRGILNARTTGTSGLPQWPLERLAFTPEIADSGLQVFDYAAMLVAELEACAELTGTSDLFSEEIKALKDQIISTHWSAKRKAFFDRTADGEFAKRLTAGTLLPLLWKQVPGEIRKGLLPRLTGPELFSPLGVKQWEKRDTDPNDPPVRTLTQHHLLSLLDSYTDEAGSRLSASWHRGLEAFSEKNVQDSAALQIRLLPYARKVNPKLETYPGWVLFLEKHRRGFIGTAAGLLFLCPVLFGILYAMQPAYGRVEEHMTASHAASLVRLDQLEDAERIYTDLLLNSRSSTRFANYHLLRGNIRYHSKNIEGALQDYLKVAELDDSKEIHTARWNLAQAYRELGRVSEATQAFRDFITEYGTELPELASRAKIAISLMESK